MIRSETAVLRRYFGFRPGTGVKEFAEELRALTAAERAELARLASVEFDLA